MFTIQFSGVFVECFCAILYSPTNLKQSKTAVSKDHQSISNWLTMQYLKFISIFKRNLPFLSHVSFYYANFRLINKMPHQYVNGVKIGMHLGITTDKKQTYEFCWSNEIKCCRPCYFNHNSRVYKPYVTRLGFEGCVLISILQRHKFNEWSIITTGKLP